MSRKNSRIGVNIELNKRQVLQDFRDIEKAKNNLENLQIRVQDIQKRDDQKGVTEATWQDPFAGTDENLAQGLKEAQKELSTNVQSLSK